MQPNNPQQPNLPAGSRPQFFDVVRPGRTPASPNSRPVLPSSRPAVQDTSMMKMGAPAVPPGLMNQPPAPATIQVPTPASPVAPPQSVIAPVVMQPTQSSPMGQQPKRVFSPSPIATQPAPLEPVAPVVEPDLSVSQAQPTKQQKHSFWSEFFAILAILLLIGVIFNILLDAEIIDLPVPHTNFFEY